MINHPPRRIAEVNTPRRTMEVKLSPPCGCLLFGALAIIVVLPTVAAVKVLIEFILR